MADSFNFVCGASKRFLAPTGSLGDLLPVVTPRLNCDYVRERLIVQTQVKPFLFQSVRMGHYVSDEIESHCGPPPLPYAGPPPFPVDPPPLPALPLAETVAPPAMISNEAVRASLENLPDATKAPMLVSRSFIRRFFDGVASLVEWLFGAAVIVVGLAVLSVLPVLNFLSLGYLLNASGTVARTGRLRDGLVGVRKAAVIGRFIAGTWLVLWPVRIISGFWKDAVLIAPDGANARAWRIGLVVATFLTLWHIVWACLRSGKLRHFLWPAPLGFVRWLRTPDKYETTRNAVIEYVLSLRLPFYFWLGLRGFVGALAWLIIPVGILLLASRLPPAGAALLSLPGGFLLFLTAMYLPFLQARFALTGDFSDLFALREIRALFTRAPVAFWLALLVTLLFALPLYLLKVELTPRELAWLPSLVFVSFILPARLLTGWAVGRALRREQPRHALFRWVSRLAILPVAGVYVLFVYLSQFFSWNGAWSFLEQHAFLVPAPLMTL